MRNKDDPDYGWIPFTNLHSEETLPGARCCMNLHSNCWGPQCAAWRWLWDEDKRVTFTDDDGIEQGVGWCGVSAYPLIGRKAF